jgi:hypothetical protein
MMPELHGVEISVQTNSIFIKVDRFNDNITKAREKAMRALAILLEEEKEPLKIKSEVKPAPASEAPAPSLVPRATEGLSKQKAAWTPERRQAQAEKMRGNRIRRDSVASVKPPVPVADPPPAPLAVPDSKDYKSPNSAWRPEAQQA